MQIRRWGNSLAVRLPAAAVEALGLREGDDQTVEVGEDSRTFSVARDRNRDEALEALRGLGWTLPTGVRLTRDAADARGEEGAP